MTYHTAWINKKKREDVPQVPMCHSDSTVIQTDKVWNWTTESETTEICLILIYKHQQIHVLLPQISMYCKHEGLSLPWFIWDKDMLLHSIVYIWDVIIYPFPDVNDSWGIEHFLEPATASYNPDNLQVHKFFRHTTSPNIHNAGGRLVTGNGTHSPPFYDKCTRLSSPVFDHMLSCKSVCPWLEISHSCVNYTNRSVRGCHFHASMSHSEIINKFIFVTCIYQTCVHVICGLGLFCLKRNG